ncbi:SDR family oxidoreductase [Pseudomonadales bacterium]|jgi:meso-butanediol dehydrogenase/(S,S)-butanediol dehydrogenase/diacetyl reductase|nr:SDR family oxidoreductase [Gammaproteobacteria bacterium]MBT3736457.1 SDR family oxidoreductase [Gammaproteobacteria bacterium]MBT7540482.1 SDR family oxidoreductase [Gammaproteobacteria bacterium]MDA7832758.1 SDR family oxidoreductase [Pseudomonadales bacterium]MDC1479479.1 SDR family oxidoreductase [Pseudomonadales bacterium]|tara:strand:+ start:5187 stop:5990 length:804 start_codon:yes stop_codon:yes gene_type:complete
MDNRVVLVTGGARGIGLGIVKAFASIGCRVMIADLGLESESEWNYGLANKDDMDKAIDSAGALGEVASCGLDVTDRASCENAVQATVDRFGQLDVLINNAGVVQTGPVVDFSEEDWDSVFAVNTKGIFLMAKAAIPALSESDNAAIVNTASIAGKKGHANMSAYCGSKFAAVGITQSLAFELAPKAIRVNAICPGIVGTAMWLEHLMPMNTTDADEKNRTFEANVSQEIPLGRPQSVEDMGQAAVYLASAKNITGIALSVSGGIEMN